MTVWPLLKLGYEDKIRREVSGGGCVLVGDFVLITVLHSLNRPLFSLFSHPGRYSNSIIISSQHTDATAASVVGLEKKVEDVEVNWARKFILQKDLRKKCFWASKRMCICSQFQNVNVFSDRDPPAAHLHDLEVPEHRLRPRGHHRPRDGEGERLHEGEGEEEGGTEERATAADIQRRQLLRGEKSTMYPTTRSDNIHIMYIVYCTNPTKQTNKPSSLRRVVSRVYIKILKKCTRMLSMQELFESVWLGIMYSRNVS